MPGCDTFLYGAGASFPLFLGRANIFFKFFQSHRTIDRSFNINIYMWNIQHRWIIELNIRGVARVFGARGTDFRLAPPPGPPRTPKIFFNSPKFVISLKLFTKFSYIKTNKIFSWAIFSSGGPSGPSIPIFLEDHICFFVNGGRQNVN